MKRNSKIKVDGHVVPDFRYFQKINGNLLIMANEEMFDALKEHLLNDDMIASFFIKEETPGGKPFLAVSYEDFIEYTPKYFQEIDGKLTLCVHGKAFDDLKDNILNNDKIVTFMVMEEEPGGAILVITHTLQEDADVNDDRVLHFSGSL